MILSIKKIIQLYGIEGDILLYRDENHRKEGLMKYLKSKLDTQNKTIITWSDGAFGLLLARAFPENQVVTYFNHISPDYGELMKVQSNLILREGYRGLDDWENICYQKYSDKDKYIIINQYKNELITEYYSNYFPIMVNALKDCHIDAFCDCGHSCQTMAGFIKGNKENKLVDWKFVLGVNFYPRKNLWQLTQYENEIEQALTKDFNTLIIGKEIEATYPEFGNVFEATRSITAAMAWLKAHPGKTVAVYIGDAYKKEGTKFGQDK